METDMFVKAAKYLIQDFYNNSLDKTDNVTLKDDDIYVVWYAKTLKNSKGLLSTRLIDGMYFEITYNGTDKEFYFDAYKKWQNKAVKVEDIDVLK
jgi:hypothetical protein